MAIILRWRYTPQVGAGDVTSLAAIVGPRGLGIASQSFKSETGIYTFTMTDGSTETVDFSGYTDSLDAIQSATEGFRNQAQGYATAAGASAGFFDFKDLATLQADTTLTYTAGQDGTVAAGDVVRLRDSGFAYEVLASDADGDIENSNGTPVQLRPLTANALAFGAVGDGSTNDTTAINNAESADLVELPFGKTFLTTKTDIAARYSGLGNIVLASPPRTFSPQRIEGKSLAPPSGFGFTPDVLPVYHSGKWRGHVSARSLASAPTGQTYYVDVLNGDDGNSGADSAPLQSINAALAKSDCGTVKIAPGWYSRDYDWGAPTITTTSPIVVEPWNIRPGRVVNCSDWNHRPDLWTKDATYDKIYSATRSSVLRVIDTAHTDLFFADGQEVIRWREYSVAASASDCNNNPGTWFQDGSTLYVHPLTIIKGDEFPASDTYNTANAEAAICPSSSIKVILSETSAFFNDDVPLYVEGIDFYGGDEAFWGNITTAGFTNRAIFSDCSFMYAGHATDGNGVRWVGGEMQVIFERCRSMFNTRDGFNYKFHATGGTPNIIEIDCLGLFNGDTGDGNNNGTTTHDGINALRIGGMFGLGEGPSLADTGGGDSWIVGTKVLQSRKIASSITKSSLYNSACAFWVYDVSIDESANNAAAVTSSGTTYLHNVNADGAFTESGGSFASYVQT